MDFILCFYLLLLDPLKCESCNIIGLGTIHRTGFIGDTWTPLLMCIVKHRTIHTRCLTDICTTSSVIRAIVPKLNLDDVFEQKNDIARAVEDELGKAMSSYGYKIVQTLIVDIEPDNHVKKAMNEINAASRMRVAANEKAEAEKILQIKRAEGEAESKYLSGLGIARQRQAIVDGLRDSVLAFSVNVPGTTAKDVMDMVLVTQYFDTMKEIGASSKSSSVFIPHGPGAVRDIAAQVRDGLLQGSAIH